jgi:hypothetical protein
VVASYGSGPSICSTPRISRPKRRLNPHRPSAHLWARRDEHWIGR